MNAPSQTPLQLIDLLREDFITRFPSAAVAHLETLDDLALRRETASLGISAQLTLLDRLSPLRATAIFAALEINEQAALIAAAPTHLALQLATSLNEEAQAGLLAALPAGIRSELKRLVELPPACAGRYMDQAVAVLTPELRVAEAIERIRASPVRQTGPVYLTDSKRHLVGRVDMRTLALADPGELVAAHASAAPAVGLMAPRKEIVDLFEHSRAESLPVVDRNNRLLGVLRHQQLVEAMSEAASADLQKMVGGSPDEQALSTPGFAVRRRLPWLQINLLTAFLASAVVSLFEGLIAQFTALAVLLPVVAGQSGNAGAQALAVTIRGLVLREVGSRELPRLIYKELLTGLANGIALALVCGAGVYLWSSSVGLALVIALAMVLSMPAAGIAGAIVPMILTRMGQDPATASSIILTTVTDVFGFFSFLGIALLLSTTL